MRISTIEQLEEISKTRQKVFLAQISVAPNSKNLFSHDKVETTRVYDCDYYDLLRRFVTTNGCHYILLNPNIALFTTEDETKAYIEDFKAKNYDKIRKILSKRKKYYLEKIENLNKRMSLLK